MCDGVQVNPSGGETALPAVKGRWIPASNPTGSKSLPANRAASKNRLARAERALSAACAAALKCSATCHFFVLTLRLPFITALEVNYERLLLTDIET